MAAPQMLASQAGTVHGERVELWIDWDRSFFNCEFFRIHLDEETSVDIPAALLPAILNAARASQSLPASLFGDTTELVQRIDRMLSHLDGVKLAKAA